jgi:sigma-B regulation protein RsbU (phosphoserine phosphatase)
MSVHKPSQILIVDDDTTTNTMLQAILKSAGFLTCSAYDGTGAIEMLRKERPELILLDVGLPDATGIEICRRIHKEPAGAQIPILFISANEDLATKVQGFEAGGVDYITKPLYGIEVLARVSTHLRLKHAYDKLAELQAERVWKLAVTQEAIMPQPKDFPEARFEVVLNQVIKVGGDFYDVITSGSQVVDYIVADAAGHDLSASYWTSALKALLAMYADSVSSVEQILSSINNALRRILPGDVFFTVLYARLNRRAGKLSLVNAGNPPAILLQKDAGVAEIVEQDGDIIGSFPDAVFGVTELSIKPGDRFLLYSDGLVEMDSDRDAGIRRLAAECAAHGSMPLAGMLQAITASMTGKAQVRDDILLLGVEV